jgi:lipopolysaccharide transport system permease protein
MKIKKINHSAAFIQSHRTLLWRVASSELRSRYAGSILGIGWAFISPLLIISIYAVIYLVIFRVRVPNMSPLQYVLFIFSGLIPFLMTSESLGSGVGSVVANRSVLSNTVFPVDLVPVKSVLLAQFTMIVGSSVILIGSAFFGYLKWTALLLPMVWGLHLMALIGIVWILSLINLVLRDLQNIVSLLIMVLMVASPIAYTPEMVPATLKILILLNPLAYFVLAYQYILVLGQLPPWWDSLAIIVLGFGLFFAGGHFFSNAKQVLVDYV